MHVPIVRKITKNNDVLIERALPKKGQLDAASGTKVEPFTKLGMSKVSYGSLPIGSSLKLTKGKKVGTYFYTGDTVGRIGRKKIIAPFDGYLEKIPNGYLYKQEERDFWLLAGVWGDIVDVVGNYSVLLKTQTVDLHFAACTDNSYEGELIVFPNPSELLEMQYLEKFSKDSFGKIIYIGEYLDSEVVTKAAQLGVAGLIAGSADRNAFQLAKKHNIFLGVISGFGHIPTPSYIFDFLKGVTNRFVFLQGGRGIVRIPVPKPFDVQQIKNSSVTGQLRTLKKGLKVQILEEPHFGWVGTIDRIQKGEVYVMLDDVQDPVKVDIPNIISLE
jgi:hypothetical protein